MDMMPHKLGIAIHIEPKRPIELPKLLANLASVGSEYQLYSKNILGTSGKDASKLYVGSVKPGSIDIFLQPEFLDMAKAGLVIATSSGSIDATSAVLDFGKHLTKLLNKFKSKPNPTDITIRECDNAMNMAQNVVESGGTQTINYINVQGDFQPLYEMDAESAHRVFENAAETKAILKLPAAERLNSQAMLWKTFDKSPARTEGQRSPDKGIIEEIDPAPKAILFGDDEAGLKADILASDENPMQMVYYVDVEIIRVEKKIKAYRIVNFQGKDPLHNDE